MDPVDPDLDSDPELWYFHLTAQQMAKTTAHHIFTQKAQKTSEGSYLEPKYIHYRQKISILSRNHSL